MPIYEYKCAGCAAVQEEIRPMGSGPEGVVCTKCGGTSMAKVWSVIAKPVSSDGDSGDFGDDSCPGMDSCPAGGDCAGCEGADMDY